MAPLVWKIWISDSTSTATSASYWTQWCSGTTTTNSVTWSVWWDGLQVQKKAINPQPRVDPIQQARLVADRIQAEAERKAQAAAKACRIRDRFLEPRQREQLEQYGYFDLEVGSGRIYRIHGGTHGNVREMIRQPDGTLRAVASLCCQPEQVPEADAHLAQLLWLKHDEEQFRRIANIRNYDPQPYQAPARQRDLAAARA